MDKISTWTHLKENHWLSLHGLWVCLCHQDEMHQNCCICIHIKQLWFTDSMTKTAKHD